MFFIFQQEKTRYDRSMDIDERLQDLEEKKDDPTTFTDHQTVNNFKKSLKIKMEK